MTATRNAAPLAEGITIRLTPLERIMATLALTSVLGGFGWTILELVHVRDSVNRLVIYHEVINRDIARIESRVGSLESR